MSSTFWASHVERCCDISMYSRYCALPYIAMAYFEIFSAKNAFPRGRLTVCVNNSDNYQIISKSANKEKIMENALRLC